MTSKHLTIAFLVLVLLIPAARAQSRSAADADRDEEQKKARASRDRKALAVVEEIVKETQSFKLPENRIRMQMALADLLWERNEPGARSLFKDATASLGELTAMADPGDAESYNLAQLAMQMRQEMLQVVANHDAGLGLDFLRSTRPAVPQPQPYAQPNIEAQLELRLASGIAAKDVNEAVRIAEESLKKGIDYEAINLLHKLYSPDKAPAERLLTGILDRLRTEDHARNPASWYVALTLLRTWVENNRTPDSGGQRTTFNISLSNLNEQAARELSSGIISAAMNNGLGGSPQIYLFSGQNSGNLQQLKMLMPEMERLSPNQAAALSKKIAEVDKINELQQGPGAKYQELIHNGTADDLIEASKTAPPGFADHLTQQAAWKSFNQGDTDAARRLVARIEDPRQRNETTLNIDRQLAYRANEQGSLAEARAVLSRIPVAEERAGLLAQLAERAVGKGDKPAAVKLLGEARALIGEQSRNYQQLRVQLQIARVYEQLDASAGTSIVETVIEQLNELAASALVLNGFDLQQYFRDGEFVINASNPLCMIAQEVAGGLRSLALQDFDRARSAAVRFKRGELRAMALLQIAQGSLTPGAAEEAIERR